MLKQVLKYHTGSACQLPFARFAHRGQHRREGRRDRLVANFQRCGSRFFQRAIIATAACVGVRLDTTSSPVEPRREGRHGGRPEGGDPRAKPGGFVCGAMGFARSATLCRSACAGSRRGKVQFVACSAFLPGSVEKASVEQPRGIAPPGPSPEPNKENCDECRDQIGRRSIDADARMVDTNLTEEQIAGVTAFVWKTSLVAQARSAPAK